MELREGPVENQAVVKLTNILLKAFLPISFCQKIQTLAIQIIRDTFQHFSSPITTIMSHFMAIN